MTLRRILKPSPRNKRQAAVASAVDRLPAEDRLLFRMRFEH